MEVGSVSSQRLGVGWGKGAFSMQVSFNVLGLSGAVLGGYFKKTNWLQHRAKQHFCVRLGFLSVDIRAAMRSILTGGHGFSHQRVLYLRRRLDERERLFSQRRSLQAKTANRTKAKSAIAHIVFFANAKNKNE